MPEALRGGSLLGVAENNKSALHIKIHSTQRQSVNRTAITHFSILPTILVSLGFKILDGRLGLGVSAFGDISGARMKLFAEDDLDSKLSAPAPIYSKFWGTDE